METNQKPRPLRFTTTLIIAIVTVTLVAGGLLGYVIGNSTSSGRVSDLQNQLSTLQEQVSTLQSAQDNYILENNVSLSKLYEQVKDSVVIVRGLTVGGYDIFWRAYYTQVQGSGFVYNFTGEVVIVTNYHVVEDAVNITVTFINGDGYAATLLGSDPYADLAVLSTNAPRNEYEPLEVVGSSTLKVGDPVVAIGNPYELAGSTTTGIISALRRTITESMTGGYPIADVIQTSAPINSGSSGGPLLNYQGQVVGITTAIVSDSQGLGFAIPSNTILREIESLVTSHSYDQHPWLGTTGIDMTYEIAEATGGNVTYGYLIAQVISDGPADKAGLQGGAYQVSVAGEYVRIGGDIIIAINTTSVETRIRGIDDFSAFLEEYTSPNQTVYVTIVRNGQTMIVPVTLGTRPPIA